MILITSKSHGWQRFFNAALIVCAFAFSIWAQDNDPNPDSPTPILISETDSARALAISATPNAVKKTTKAFAPNERIVLYAANLRLIEGEAANAFRVVVRDQKNREFRFPVLKIELTDRRAAVYALTVELKDTLKFWKQPKTGDVLIALTWRGLTSNRLRLGFGKTGGALKDETSAAEVSSVVAETEASAAGYNYSGDRKRLMEQATFGPTAELDQRIRRLGVPTWLAEQFSAPYPTVPYPDIPLMPSNAPSNCNGTENPNLIPVDPPDIYPNCRRDRYTLFPVQNWFFKEAFYGNAQLKHRTAWALSQMWVVSGVDTQQSAHFIPYHQVLSRHAFGNYRNLMREMTLNAAMGNYLDMARSTKDDPNENFAREILQLFSIGVFMLNPDGTVQRDKNNQPIPTYNQATVNNFTKVFTGWTFCEVTASCPNRQLGIVNYKDSLLLRPENHDATAKTLLEYPNAVNQEIEADLDGSAELEKALDNIYYHPNVAPFVSRFLIQHLITSDPTPAFVERVAAVFNENRENPAQLKEVVKAILLDAEARGNVKTDPHYGKLREPVQLATNLLRQFDVRSANDSNVQSDGYVSYLVAPMGQTTFYSPNVFNYYAPDYTVPGPGLNGPEFGLMTTGTAIARTNFINTMVFNRVGVSVNTETGTAIDLTELRLLASNDHSSVSLLDALNRKLMHGTLTAQNKATILAAVQTVPRSNPLLRAQMAVYLVMTSSQYQVQR